MLTKVFTTYVVFVISIFILFSEKLSLAYGKSKNSDILKVPEKSTNTSLQKLTNEIVRTNSATRSVSNTGTDSINILTSELPNEYAASMNDIKRKKSSKFISVPKEERVVKSLSKALNEASLFKDKEDSYFLSRPKSMHQVKKVAKINSTNEKSSSSQSIKVENNQILPLDNNKKVEEVTITIEPEKDISQERLHVAPFLAYPVKKKVNKNV